VGAHAGAGDPLHPPSPYEPDAHLSPAPCKSDAHLSASLTGVAPLQVEREGKEKLFYRIAHADVAPGSAWRSGARAARSDALRDEPLRMGSEASRPGLCAVQRWCLLCNAVTLRRACAGVG